MDDFIPRPVGRGREVVAAVDRSVVDEDVDSAPLFDEFSRHLLHANAIDYGDFGIKCAASMSLDLTIHFLGEVVARIVTKSSLE